MPGMNILLVGASGYMGRAVAEAAAATGHTIVAGVDPVETKARFPIQKNMKSAPPSDVLIDFSRPESLEGILEYCTRTRTGAVLATTGYDEKQREAIARVSDEIPVFHSSNFSIGVSLLRELAQRAAEVLGRTADVEIVERHHNRKVDAPSGTAYMLADAVAEALPGSSEYVYGREGTNSKRKPGEIGIHAVRGGSVVGEHTVMFLSPDEELQLTHSAYSRKVFANGALTAAVFVSEKKTGLFGMNDLLKYLISKS